MTEKEKESLFIETKKSQEQKEMTQKLFTLLRKFATEESEKITFPSDKVRSECYYSAVKYLMYTWESFNFEKFHSSKNSYVYYKEIIRRGFQRGINQYKATSNSIKSKDEVRIKLLSEIKDLSKVDELISFIYNEKEINLFKESLEKNKTF
jgi:hypothetical protein